MTIFIKMVMFRNCLSFTYFLSWKFLYEGIEIMIYEKWDILNKNITAVRKSIIFLQVLSEKI